MSKYFFILPGQIAGISGPPWGRLKAKTYAEFQPAGREDARRRARPTTINARLWHDTGQPLEAR